jgi:hypothetical protein
LVDVLDNYTFAKLQTVQAIPKVEVKDIQAVLDFGQMTDDFIEAFLLLDRETGIE